MPEISKWFKPQDENDDAQNSEDEIRNLSTLSPAVPPSSPVVSSSEEPSTSSHQSSGSAQDANPSSSFNETFELLKQIFVGRDPEELTMAALKNENVHDAINDILDSTLDDNVLSGKESAYYGSVL